MYISQETPLHAASEQGQIEMVQFLVENGAEIDAANDSQVKFTFFAYLLILLFYSTYTNLRFLKQDEELTSLD